MFEQNPDFEASPHPIIRITRKKTRFFHTIHIAQQH